jgi:PAS domain S-box-containing protein
VSSASIIAGRLTYVNAAAKRMFGCRADEVLGRELAGGGI